jgi:hypothetical protein
MGAVESGSGTAPALRGGASLRAIACTLALLSSACAFDTRPIRSHVELESARIATGSVQAPQQLGYDNPGLGMPPPPIAGASGLQAPPAATMRVDAAIATTPVADSGAAPMDAVDAIAPAPDPAEDPIDAAPPASDAAEDVLEAGDPTGPTVPVPGAMFSRCSQNSECTEGMICTSNTMVAVPPATTAIGYCTVFCPWVNGSGSECPQPSSGQVKSSCQVGSSLCQLASCERLQCPNGLHCQQSETPIGGGQVVSDFECQP